MTRPLAKRLERFYAEEAARLLGRVWILGDDREHPDFLITESGSQFGLEITQIFKGPKGPGGSELKAKESITQRRVNEIQREYEAIANVPLMVKFVGNSEAMQAANLATVVPALVAEDLPSKPIGYHFVHDTSVAHPARSRLRVHVTKGFRPDWCSVNNRVGYVDRNPRELIAAAIETKANELTRYRADTGDDIRLLLVADGINNSGKVKLENATQFDFRGFTAVYFFPYPESVIVLDNATGRLF